MRFNIIVKPIPLNGAETGRITVTYMKKIMVFVNAEGLGRESGLKTPGTET
ncbi:hypothetical protein DPMN_066668 [Dreissena polymorpha]|uniref:Uncharacterized protein n=1 Tax=Dreissena polymorpha TaxID=45954 RepID=A0A9D4BV75_DREPO|nr:hypothetical protein DPMN_066668 [Dreissena polymorpha]